MIDGAQLGDNAGNFSALHQKLGDGRLLELQIRFPFENVLHMFLIAAAVCLCAKGMYGGSFAAVEHPILNAAGIGGFCHLSAERIEFTHQMPFAGAADGRVAGHIADGIQIDGKNNGAKTEPCGSQRRFNSGMTGADHGNIKFSCEISHIIRSLAR